MATQKKYDAAKAHEYYMRTRKLKGRTSTAGLSQSQKEMAQYVKAELKAELKAEREKLAEARNERKKELASNLKSSIESLRARAGKVKRGSPEAQRLKDEIAKLREKTKQDKQAVSDEYKASYAKAKEANQAEYERELDKIRKSKK